MAEYYPPVAFAFSVSIDGNAQGVDASFSEVSGLESTVDTQEVREGGENRYVHKLPTRVQNSNLVLKRGLMVAASPLYGWCKSVMEDGLAKPIQPKAIIVTLLGPEQSPMIAWSVDRAWPVKWQVAEFRASENALAFETLEFAYATVTRKLIHTKPKTGMFQS